MEKEDWAPDYSDLHGSIQEVETSLRLKLKDNASAGAPSKNDDLYPTSLDCISEIEPGLYMSSWKCAADSNAREDRRITHVVSAMSLRPQLEDVDEKNHLWFNVEDASSQNMIQLFEEFNSFVHNAIARNGRVLVHCFAGYSRSACLVAAYLMKQHHWTTSETLHFIAERRPGISPNPAFLRQLKVFEECDYEPTREKKPFRLWLFKQYGHFAMLNTQTPSDVAYNELVAAKTGDSEARCKKCRFILAGSNYIVPHEPKTKNSAMKCNHIFLEPLRWMQPELEKGELEGRFHCPKCSSKLGTYKWQGMQCNCLSWICPALSLQLSRVDIVKRIAVAPRGATATGNILQALQRR
ncbi:phosphoprotein phosphatase [Schizosaccharomyces japonicus yFS275]|uniref:protein-tyrosine-phosphatase n=1 Tax=Schizosaccharomyces japonicus (strain yFS275 / FY16936) TaxID=402676 RepID=B6JZX3_SCHJY|nr:phosphoprotein phosphatase [Schizosaccharomyces japonicus yFS275]EEB06123.1 phosphoprotein phosphatase [Schizosaccharomyces japonicus yFS275]